MMGTDLDITQEFSAKKKVVIAPLNWGLGHASRCISLINIALKSGCEVVIASDGDALTMLRKYFPQLKYYELPGYEVHYKYDSIIINLSLQSARLLKVIDREHKAFSEIINAEKPDLIISDNRIGCYSKEVKSIVISHQLKPHHSWMIFRLWMYGVTKFVFRNFSEIWVPDYASRSLSGSLSIGDKYKQPIKYIGPQSALTPPSSSNEEIDILLLLSGPEPQRQILEDGLLQTIAQESKLANKKILVIRGKFEGENKTKTIGKTTIVDHRIGDQLAEALKAAKIVICRSGYSTLMDLALFNKDKVILIATPGQTEQEYLAEYHSEQGVWKSCYQKDLANLVSTIEHFDL